METSTLIAGFVQVVGAAVADLKSRTLAEIDIEQLKLKRSVLDEKLEDFKKDMTEKARQEKAALEQEMISRGLGNTSIRISHLHAIDEQASTDTERATREYNRAIEEIALLERKVRELADPVWRRIWWWLRGR